MTDKQEQQLQKLEQSMREHGIAISNNSIRMDGIDKKAATNALRGIMQYLQETLSDIEE